MLRVPLEPLADDGLLLCLVGLERVAHLANTRVLGANALIRVAHRRVELGAEWIDEAPRRVQAQEVDGHVAQSRR